MDVRHCSSKSLAVIPLLCLYLIAILCIAAQASSPLPWETENSIRNALAQQEGTNVVCEGVVERIAARNNPAFFVLRDEFKANNQPESRMVVLCRPPLNLSGVVRVTGMLSRLLNNELCIINPTVEGLFDAEGRPVYWTPFLGFLDNNNWQALPVPTGPIPPSDPSLVDDGMGIPGEVTAYAIEGVSRYDTIASLLASAPPILSRVELAAKPIISVGDGYIVVGDDNSDSTVKLYANNTSVKSTDRLIKATAIVHSEAGQLVLYAGNGVQPFFDPTGRDAAGGTSIAKPGSVAYAGTLRDTTTSEARTAALRSGRVSIMSIESPTTSDGSWCYLTGMVVTAVGKYYSYDIMGHAWIPIYYIQGLDRMPGIRVLDTSAYPPGVSTGKVVDVMAKLDTKDGERILGIIDPWDDSSVECKVLDNNGWHLPRPVGMNNKALGGTSIGNNPGIVGDPYGLYNIGSYVTIWGKVLERGTYQLDWDSYYSTPYIRIDDGSGVATGNSSYGGPYGNKGVTVFGTNTYDGYTPINVGDCVAVTGASSVWRPDGSSDTYRAMWLANKVQNVNSMSSSEYPPYTDTISGTVTLYDMATDTAEVTLYSTCGRTETLTVTRGLGNVGTASYSWSNVPMYDPYWNWAYYMISAKCDGYKTRTYTEISSGTTKNLYLVATRKIYLRTQENRYTIGPCSPSSLAVIAKVVNDNHAGIAYPNPGGTVRFSTTAGSFNPTTLQQTATAHTNANGEATVTLYGVYWSGSATIAATDDLTTPEYADTTDDTYRCDWEQLSNSVYIYQPNVSLQLTPYSIDGAICDTQSVLTATLNVCNSPKSGETVTFHATNGTFAESGTKSVQRTTASDGTANATLLRPSLCVAGTDDVYVEAAPYSIQTTSNHIYATWHGWELNVTVNPDWVVHGNPATVKAKLTADNGTTPVVGQSITLTTNQGLFANSQTSYTATTNGDGEISTTLTVTACPVTANVTGTTTTCSGGCTFTDSDTLLVICNANDAKTLIVALDGTGSMDSGAKASDGLNQLMQDLKTSGKALLVGGVKFGNYIADPYYTPDYEQAILLPTSDYDAVIEWINSRTGADGGADINENGLEALKKASEIGLTNTYIALATDAGFHYWGDNEDPNSTDHSGSDCIYTTLTTLQTRTILSSANCKVYIDAGNGGHDYTAVDDYTNGMLYVNGAMEDTSFGSYTFPKLTAALLQ